MDFRRILPKMLPFASPVSEGVAKVGRLLRMNGTPAEQLTVGTDVMYMARFLKNGEVVPSSTVDENKIGKLYFCVAVEDLPVSPTLAVYAYVATTNALYEWSSGIWTLLSMVSAREIDGAMFLWVDPLTGGDYMASLSSNNQQTGGAAPIPIGSPATPTTNGSLGILSLAADNVSELARNLAATPYLAKLLAQRTLDVHAQSYDVHGATSVITANRIVKWDASGRLESSTPVAGTDVANKSYADGILSTSQSYTQSYVNSIVAGLNFGARGAVMTYHGDLSRLVASFVSGDIGGVAWLMSNSSEVDPLWLRLVRNGAYWSFGSSQLPTDTGWALIWKG